MSERCAVIFVNKMIRMRIFAKDVIDIGSEKQVQYCMNPIYFFNEKWLSLNLYLLFKVDLKEGLAVGVRKRFNDVELGKWWKVLHLFVLTNKYRQEKNEHKNKFILAFN